MENTDRLFLLIKSLNKNEKIYFKRYSKKQTNNYIKLFDAIDAQKEYNEDQLLKKFAKEKFSARLRNTKGLLFQSILKSLQDYHHDISTGFTLKNNLLQIEILFGKGLYDTCLKLLAKTKALAESFDVALILLEIFNWKRKILYHLISDSTKLELELTNMKRDEMGVLKKYANAKEYTFLIDKISLFSLYEGANKSIENEIVLDKLAKNTLLKNENKALSIEAKLAYNLFFELFYDLKKDPWKGIKYSERRTELMEQHPEIIKPRPILYLYILANLTSVYCRLKDYSKGLSILHKIKQLPVKTIDSQVQKFQCYFDLEIEIYNELGEFQKGAILIANTNKEFNRLEEKIELGFLLNCYFQIAYTFFGLDDCKASLKWLNKILNKKNEGKREEIINKAKILNLIVHFEMRNEDLLESKIKSAIRFFDNKVSSDENNKTQYHYEILFVQALSEIIEETNHKNIIVTMKNLKEKMIGKSNKDVNIILSDNYKLILNWLDSKIEKKSFAEIIREKAKHV